MKEQTLSETRNANIRHLREAATARVENTSLRSVAREIGMSPTGLKKFLLGTSPYAPTLRRLRSWYVQYADRETGQVRMEEAQAALALLIHDLSPEPRQHTSTCVLDCLKTGYQASGKAPPGWMEELARRMAGAPGEPV